MRPTLLHRLRDYYEETPAYVRLQLNVLLTILIIIATSKLLLWAISLLK